MRIFLGALVALIVISGCSTNAFNPEYITGTRKLIPVEAKPVMMQHIKGVTFQDGSVLRANGLIEGFTLPQGYAYLNDAQGVIIAADNGGSVLIFDTHSGQKQHLAFTKRIISATKEGNLLATVNASNEAQLMDLDRNETRFGHTGSEVLAVDMRLANPYFYDDLIFYPSLDGKVQIYSQAKEEMVRTMSISTEEHFNNVIFFAINGKKVIAATGSALYLFSTEIKKESMPIRSVHLIEDRLFVLSKEGTIVRFTLDVEREKSVKFKFAHLAGLIQSEQKLFVIENEGYLIELSKDLENYYLYKLAFDEQYFFNGQTRFYFSNGYYQP